MRSIWSTGVAFGFVSALACSSAPPLEESAASGSEVTTCAPGYSYSCSSMPGGRLFNCGCHKNCVAGTHTCSDPDVAATCVSGVWHMQSCPLGCEDGTCAACVDGTKSCSGNNVVTCATGQWRGAVTTCGETCSSGACSCADAKTTCGANKTLNALFVAMPTSDCPMLTVPNRDGGYETLIGNAGITWLGFRLGGARASAAVATSPALKAALLGGQNFCVYEPADANVPLCALDTSALQTVGASDVENICMPQTLPAPPAATPVSSCQAASNLTCPPPSTSMICGGIGTYTADVNTTPLVVTRDSWSCPTITAWPQAGGLGRVYTFKGTDGWLGLGQNEGECSAGQVTIAGSAALRQAIGTGQPFCFYAPDSTSSTGTAALALCDGDSLNVDQDCAPPAWVQQPGSTPCPACAYMNCKSCAGGPLPQ